MGINPVNNLDKKQIESIRMRSSYLAAFLALGFEEFLKM